MPPSAFSLELPSAFRPLHLPLFAITKPPSGHLQSSQIVAFRIQLFLSIGWRIRFRPGMAGRKFLAPAASQVQFKAEGKTSVETLPHLAAFVSVKVNGACWSARKPSLSRFVRRIGRRY